MRAAPADEVVRDVVAFGRLLRLAGLEVGPGRVADALAGLDAVSARDGQYVYWTLRATLVARADDLDAFDAAFRIWFLGAAPDSPDAPGSADAVERLAT